MQHGVGFYTGLTRLTPLRAESLKRTTEEGSVLGRGGGELAQELAVKHECTAD